MRTGTIALMTWRNECRQVGNHRPSLCLVDRTGSCSRTATTGRKAYGAPAGKRYGPSWASRVPRTASGSAGNDPRNAAGCGAAMGEAFGDEALVAPLRDQIIVAAALFVG